MSPFRPFLLPQPRVFSEPPLALKPNFYAPGASSFLSITCRLLVSLCSLFRARFLCFHQLTASFSKTPGGGAYLCDSSAYSAPLHPAWPELRGESRRAHCHFPLTLSPRCTTLLRELIHPFSRRSLCALSTFRINTCKSVSKQMTLTPFRINTYEKPGRGWPR